ncbi:hypothetical protein EV714DRAFT_278451 [Schizophyllum commune]
MLGSNRSSSGEQGISFAPFAFACPVFPSRLPPPLGDVYAYRRPPSEDPSPSPSPSPPPSALDCATLLVLTFSPLFELTAPPATPSILVSNNFNTPRGLGADAHTRSLDVEGISSALPLARLSTPRSH